MIKGLTNDPEDEETLLSHRVIVLTNVEMTLAEVGTLLRAVTTLTVIVIEIDPTVIVEGEAEDPKGIEG